jgi:acetyl esterase
VSAEPVFDPAFAEAVAQLKAAGVESADPLKHSLHEARVIQDRYFAFLAQDPPAVDETRDVEIAGPGGAVRMRMYYPTRERNTPVALFVRGAGWWAGSLDSHDRTMRLCALKTGFAVCGIDYHRSPEAKFPTQLEEVLAAVQWLTANGASVQVDAQRMLLWGESAGASLSVLAAAKLGADSAFLKGLLLFYGNFEGPTEATRAYSKWVWTQYLGGDWQNPNPAAIPLKADVSKFPPTWLGVGDLDPLLKDTIGLADKLAAAGVPHEVKRYPGLPHAFVTMNRVFTGAEPAIEDAARAGRRMVGRD